MAGRQPKLYRELATWFHLLTAPEDYAEEARIYRQILIKHAKARPKTLLELGSGGGNNASHMKKYFAMTLTDLSPGMIKLSKSINPECEHVVGDMRSLRLRREFDAVFVHDAVMYMTTKRDLRAAIETAFVHCKPGGIALFTPDCTTETYRAETHCGGHDGADGRGLRYLEWRWDAEPNDGTYHHDYAYIMREPNGRVRVEQDRHVFGVFARTDWLQLMRDAGFRARSTSFVHSESGRLPGFVGIHP
jgi:SAM-dependent methyltransferase